MARWVWLVLVAMFLGCSTSDGERTGGNPVASITSPLAQSYPVCGKTKSTATGVPWSPCASLDSECMRGTWDPNDACCHLEPRFQGTTCSTGQCNGLGKCEKSQDPKDRDGDGIDDSKDPVLGLDGWIQAYGDHEASVWSDIFGDNRLELRLDGEAVAWIPTSPAIDLSKVEVAVAPEPKKRHAVFVSAPVAWTEIELDAGEGYEVCLPKPGTDPDLPMPADCKAQYLQRLQCPAQLPDGTDCSFENGILHLRAPNLELAWLPMNGKSEDIRVLTLPWRLPIDICRYCDDFPGDFPPPRLHIETCNGVDDNEDGRVDEGGSRLCDDGVRCTVDACHGKDGCTHAPQNTSGFCFSAAECMELRCNEPFTGGPHREVTTEPDANGCYRVLKHDFCTDEWDGCACNGREKCDPWHSPAPPRSLTPWAETRGCMAETPPLELPCEQLNGDGDGCSTELCCEAWNPTECRVHRRIQAAGAAAVSAYQTACDFPFGEHSADGSLFCPDDPVRHAPDSYGAHCNDGNPCNTDTCNPPSGACSHTILPSGPQPGCAGVIGQGCGQLQCSAGECMQMARTPDASDPYQCHDWATAEVDGGIFWAPTCFRNQCSGAACLHVPDATQCSDGQFCNGAETCSLANLVSQDPGAFIAGATSTPGHWWGCGPATTPPCSDGVGCTNDICNEATDSCTHLASDMACHTARGLTHDACAPRFRCQCTGPDCGTRQPDGCSPLPLGFLTCNDHNPCTSDTCTCDEFCETATCGHTNTCTFPGTGGLPGVGGFGNAPAFGGFGGSGG